MKMFRSTLLACLLFVFAFSANAQSTVNSSSQSNQTTTSSSGANAQTNGNAQIIAFNSAPQPTRTTERIESAPAIALGSFGVSFSSNNCSNTVAGAISVIKLGVSGGKAVMERSCSFLVQATGFGNMANHYQSLREIALQRANNCVAGADGKTPVCTVLPSAVAEAQVAAEQQRRWEAMAGYAFCNTSDDELKACERMGLIVAEKDKRGDTVGYAPAYQPQAVDVSAIATTVRRADDASQQAAAAVQQQSFQSASSHGTLDTTSVAQQPWYQAARADGAALGGRGR